MTVQVFGLLLEHLLEFFVGGRRAAERPLVQVQRGVDGVL